MRSFLFLALAFSLQVQAGGLSGKTADGCSYKIINGQYLTSCPGKQVAEPSPIASEPSKVNGGRPVGTYGDVPVRHNPAASAPTMQPRVQTQPAPAPYISSSIENESHGSAASDADDSRRERLKNRLLDKTYAGILLGASNMKDSNAGSAMGVGLNLGTNIDDHFGVELGYSYAKQNLRLGLAARGSNLDQGTPGSNYSSDAELSSHLLTGEFQAHLTDPLKRLRPYFGAGLGWRSATLNENRTNNQQQPGVSTSSGGGSLHQSALGGLATAGTKLRLSKSFQLGFAFRYFFPLFRQDARLEQPITAASNGEAGQPTASESKLSKGDDSITGSSQYQVVGGVQYAF